MISKQMQRQYKIWGSVIVLFYVVCFGFLKIHDFQVWTLAPFIESLIGVFMGAGAIAVITGIILIFQSSIQAEQEKKQEVFKEKMKLYTSIIDKMETIRKDDKISTDEDKEIISILAKIGLLSNQNTYEQFNDFIKNLKDEEGNISEKYTSLLLDFISAARDDLEVQEAMTIEQKEALKKTKEQSKEVAENLVSGYGSRFSTEKGKYSESELSKLLSDYFSDKECKNEKERRKKEEKERRKEGEEREGEGKREEGRKKGEGKEEEGRRERRGEGEGGGEEGRRKKKGEVKRMERWKGEERN